MIYNETIRALVFGTAGTGKTTICNYLAKGNQPVSDSILGVTFDSFVYPTFKAGENSISLTDTVGLNESTKGTVKASEAIKNLMKLLRSSSEGYNLMIHVVKAGRLDKNTVDNYDLFIKTIAENKVPVIMVVTHGDSLDDTRPMEDWVTENKDKIEKTLGLRYKKILVVSFNKSNKPAFEEVYSQYRSKSIEDLIDAIITYSSMTPTKIYEDRRDIPSMFMRVWNYFCAWAGRSDWRYEINQGIRKILRAIFPEEEVEEIARDFD
ncbi:hypothetical protein GCM10028808_57890 [Spirosoma migulaei]